MDHALESATHVVVRLAEWDGIDPADYLEEEVPYTGEDDPAGYLPRPSLN